MSNYIYRSVVNFIWVVVEIVVHMNQKGENNLMGKVEVIDEIIDYVVIIKVVV